MSRLLAVPFLCAILSTPTLAQEPTSKPGDAADKQPAVALARLSGLYSDLAEEGVDLTAALLGGGIKPKSFYDAIRQLENLAEEAATREVLVDLTGTYSINLAQMAELERVLRKLRKSGKKLWAYLDNADSAAVQVASQCDRVLMADMGTIDLPSVALSVTFMKDALDLLGVQFDIVRCGDFKGAVEPFMLSRMSEHLRKHYLLMVGKINDDIVRRIAAGRGLASGKIRELQGQRLLTAGQAKAAGLVDEIVPWIGAGAALAKVKGEAKVELRDVLKKESKRQTLNFFTLMSNLLNPKERSEEVAAGLVVLHLSGDIVDGEKASPGSIVSGPTVKEIRKIAADEAVKGVVVRVNSPGGSATASEAILLALKDLAKVKPVVFSMGWVAASGGYYVTCIGRPILAEAGTITGSIGVFGMRPSLGALMRRVGIHEELVALDEGASFMAIGQPWSDEQKATVQTFVDEVYERFTGHVAASRNIPVADVLKIAGGRVWSGEQAVEIRLVDRIGGLADATEMVAKEAGLSGDYAVTHLPRPVDPFQVMIQELMDAGVLLPDPRVRALAKKLGGLDRALRIVSDALSAERPTVVWAMLPECIRLR